MKRRVGVYRILGNDLPPRHRLGQTRENLAFTLRHEPDLPGATKIWVVNRILDLEEEQRLLQRLQATDSESIQIPYNFEEYKEFLKTSPSRHDKLKQMIQYNAVRNFIIKDGVKRGFEWVLPLDGNCCFTKGGWRSLVHRLEHPPGFLRRRLMIEMVFIPMYRLKNNQEYFDFDHIKHKYAEHEPQVAIRRNCEVRFDESLVYGNKNKIELFERLRIPHRWTQNAVVVKDKRFNGGYVVRLSSGVPEADGDMGLRSRIREKSISLFLERASSFFDLKNTAQRLNSC